MYKGKRVEDHYSDEEAEINEEMVTQEPVEGEVDGQEQQQLVTIPRHVAAENFKNRKTAYLHASFTGTPEEFAQNKQRLEWHISDSQGRLLKHNLAAVNRHTAGDDDLHGGLGTVVPLDFEVVAIRNSLPWDANIHVDGLMPAVVTAHEPALWVIPAHTAYTMVQRKVFEPTHFVEEHLIETAQQCSLADVDEDIQVVKGDKAKGKSSYGTVAVGTLAHAGLLKHLEKGMWRNEPLSAEHWEEIYDTPSHRRTLHVTSKMALELKEEMQKHLLELKKRCIDLENMAIRCSRGDGRVHPNNPEGLHGQLVGSDIDPSQHLTDDTLNKVGNITFCGALTYSALTLE